MRILVVEDDQFFAQFISEQLRDEGIDVKVVQSAQDALAEDPRTYEGAIVDVMLPNSPELSGISIEESRGGFWTGVCITRQLLRKNAGLKVVLFTSAVGGGEAEIWAREQSVGFVRKDEGSKVLMRTLRRLLPVGTVPTPSSVIATERLYSEYS
jgi:CheY-like chemotaxis protein